MTKVFLLFDVGVISGVKEEWNSSVWGEKSKLCFAFQRKGQTKGRVLHLWSGGGECRPAGMRVHLLPNWPFSLERGWDGGPVWPGGLPHCCKGSQPGFTTVVALVTCFGNTGHP